MKILILSSLFPPNIFGGAEIVAYNMAKILAQRGHEVSVATSQEKHEERGGPRNSDSVLSSESAL
jgi:hypothetical protein